MDEAENLNARQFRFALGIIEGKTGEQAYVDAGYKARDAVARTNASKLLTNPNVSAFIHSKRGQLEQETDVKAADVIRELARIGLASGKNSWERFSMELKMTDKLRALEMLGKHLGIFDVSDRSDKTLMEQMHEQMIKEDDGYSGERTE